MPIVNKRFDVNSEQLREWPIETMSRKFTFTRMGFLCYRVDKEW